MKEPVIRELTTEIEIHAPTDRVWSILTDLKQFAAWNPLITQAEGDVKEGARLRVHMKLPGRTAMTSKLTVVVVHVAAERELRWLGHVLHPGVFTGEQSFELSPLGEGRTRFVQREAFRGLLVPFLPNGLAAITRRGFEAMNVALKAQAEAES